jgi:hypothetical protein
MTGLPIADRLRGAARGNTERKQMRALAGSLRLAAATLSFLIAAVFLERTWNPLGNGYWSGYRDSPDGLYLTMAAIGGCLATAFLTSGILLLSRRFRVYGGFAVLAAAALIASLLPYVLFKWTSEPETWPWAFLIEDSIAWLHFAPRPRADGIAIQIGLAAVTIGALAAQFAVWRYEKGGSRRPLRSVTAEN